MNDDINENSIIVKHLPNNFSLNDCEEFFSFFNSKSVTYFDKKGPMYHTAIVTFYCHDDACKAIFSLHERKILNTRLCAQFLKLKSNLHEKSSEANKINTTNENVKASNSIPLWITKLLSIAPKLGLNNPIQPKLKYNYPKPNNIILTNIVRSLIANEKFYYQTLHLMNKFHFPAPFTTEYNISGNAVVVNCEELASSAETCKRRYDAEMDISSGNETEISDDESLHKIEKRRKLSFPKIPSNPLSNNYEFISKPTVSIELKDVFESQETKSDNQIHFSEIQSITSNNKNHQSEFLLVEEGFGKLIYEPELNSVEKPEHIIDKCVDEQNDGQSISLITEDFKLRKEKSSKVSVLSKDNEKLSIDFIEKPNRIIPLTEIQKNIVPQSEWASVNALKNYQRGLPSNQLYVKNIAKNVSKEDLISLYAGFVDWSCQVEISSFQVTYFTEGRMKGQAFVCFSSPSIAENALESTNAFLFHGKPISVQFSKKT